MLRRAWLLIPGGVIVLIAFLMGRRTGRYVLVPIPREDEEWRSGVAPGDDA